MTPPQLHAFQELNDALITAPALAIPNLSQPFTLDVDASKLGFGATLLQKDGAGQQQVCAYMSRTTTPSERRWAHPNKLEAQAIVWAVDRLRPYLHSPFILRTDARNLCWLMRQDLTSGMYARWVMKLSEYKFEIQHATVPAADALSRNPPVLNPLEDDTDDSTMTSAGDSGSHVNVLIAQSDDAATLSNIPTVFANIRAPPSALPEDPTLEDIMKAQERDPGIARFIYDLKQGKSTTSKQGTYYFQGDVLYHQHAGVTGLHEQLVIPTV